jgi:hypothetical protein
MPSITDIQDIKKILTMKKISNESICLTSIGNKVIMTNYRIHVSEKKWGSAMSLTMLLENVCSVESKSKSNPIILLSSVLLLATGGFLFMSPLESTSKLGMAVLALGTGLLLLWFTTRKKVVEVVSDGGARLTISVGNARDEAIKDFINSILMAKIARLEELHRQK